MRITPGSKMSGNGFTMKLPKKVLTWISFILLALVCSMCFLSCMSEPPENLGLKDGKLSKCPSKPNCVCTFEDESDSRHYIAPMSYTSSQSEAMKKIKSALNEISRSKVITETENYLHVECTSMVFRFVDDLEIFLDDSTKLIHFRSASRVGHSDLGVNKKRVETLKSKLTGI